MKLLKKLLLIKWHYFESEIIDFETINFLTGKNATGKSTIIDALQLLMLGDTTGYFFNKAANESSSRTLKGYLRGEIADDGGTGFVTLRDGTFTSYIVGEFYDNVKKNSFTVGVVFDSFDDGSHEHKFFSMEGPMPKNYFVENNIPMDYGKLRAYLSSNHKNAFYFYDTNKSYQRFLLGKMGSLNQKFYSLFRKAVPFSPIMDIEKFISDFVCDVSNKVDISDMQDNIRYYKQLEHEADLVRNRITALDKIDEMFKDYSEEEKKYMEQRYLMDRAKKQKLVDSIDELNKKIEGNLSKIEKINSKIIDLKCSLDELEKEKDRLLKEKYNSDVYKESQRLEDEKIRLQEGIKRSENILSNLGKKLNVYGYQWGANIEEFCRGFDKECDKEALQLIDELKLSMEGLKEVNREGLNKIDEKLLQSTKWRMNSYREIVQRVFFNRNNFMLSLKERLDSLNSEIANLKKGIVPYNKKLIELQYEIKKGLNNKYGKDIEVSILCELLELKNKEWHNAVEAYLHTQKFYLIVPPEYFIDALKIYDSLKFKRGFYDLGLVDCGKLMKLNIIRDRNSLAEEVLTKNTYARAYVDFLLGRVTKCRKVEELRNFRTSITPDCMLYQNFTVRQLNPERWQVPYIGKNSIERQIEIKTFEYERLSVEYEDTKKDVIALDKLKGIEPLTDNDIQNILRDIVDVDGYESMKLFYKNIIDKIGSLDLTYISKVDEKLENLEKEKRNFDVEKTKLEKESARLSEEARNIREKEIVQLKDDLQVTENEIVKSYDAEWIIDIGEERFLKELSTRKTPDSIMGAFYSQIRRTESQKEKKWDDVVAMRADYNRDYKMSYDINLRTNDFFNRELHQLRNTQLADFEDKIKDAKEKAQMQFQEDFISKLKMNIDNVKEQIGELNIALKDVSFGRDKYHFEIKPNPSYKKFYDMITDSMLLDGFNLFSFEFQSKHRDAIDELFKQIVDVGEGSLNADERAELERNIERYTDYRTYLNFDLVVTDEEGRESRLSKTITKKSGGETQTPFYISVLASFVRIYRVKHRKADMRNTLRLIVFDEAFNKMDHQRIQESLKLLRKLGLQAIVSAPTEKIADIAPLVDRNLCVTRIKERSLVKAFDPKELMEV